MIALQRSMFETIYGSMSEDGFNEEGALTVGDHDTNLFFVPSMNLQC